MRTIAALKLILRRVYQANPADADKRTSGLARGANTDTTISADFETFEL